MIGRIHFGRAARGGPRRRLGRALAGDQLSIAGLVDRDVFIHFVVLTPVAIGVPLFATGRATRLGERSARSVALGAMFAIGLAGIASALT